MPSNRKTIFTDQYRHPLSIAVHDSRLYFVDNKFEQIARVDTTGDNLKIIRDNEVDLKAVAIFRKRTGTNHICLTSNGACDQICVPSRDRGRKCICSIGYKSANENNCSPQKSFMIVSQSDRIRGFNVEDSTEAMVPVYSSDHNILHTDVHVTRNWVYWIDFSRPTWNGMYRIRPNGTEMTHVISTGIGSNGLRGLAIDWVADQIYFTNAFPHETFLEVCKLDGTNRKVLVKKVNDSPRELAVNPVKRVLYWIDYGQFPRIGKAYLDGSNWTAIVTSGISNPKDLTIDMQNYDVYWVDSFVDQIQRVGWNGGGRVIFRSGLPSPVGIAVFKSDVFWGDKNLGGVFKVCSRNLTIAKVNLF